MNEKLSGLNIFLKENSVRFSTDISLKTKTWIKRGGIAKYWIEPQSVEELTKIVSFLYSKDVKFEIVGSTSNIFFLNSYNPDIVISTLKVNKIKLHSEFVEATCGVLSKKLSLVCNSNGIEGFEGFGTLPGTIGSAVCNNSSCYNSSIDELLIEVDVLTKNGTMKLKKEELNFSKRSSAIKRKELNGVILNAYFRNNRLNNPTTLTKRTEEFKADRKKHQESPIGNLGSVFASFELKNTPKIIIWKLLKRIFKLLKIDQVKSQKMSKKIFFAIHGKRLISSYVSDYSINCFLWKNEKADDVFF